MLVHLKLENFKIWKSTEPVHLAPVTFLLGTNSSGKSSLIQSLLLIRQTVTSDDPDIDLNLGNPDSNDSVMLGQFKDLYCRHGDTNRVEIEFRWSELGTESDSAVFTASYMRGPAGSAELHTLRLGKGTRGFNVIRRKRDIYRLELDNEAKVTRRQGANFRPERSFALSEAAIAELGKAAEPIKDIGPDLLAELGKIIYLGPVRQLAQRGYVWDGSMPESLGDDGSKSIDALIASGSAWRKAQRSAKTARPPKPNLFIKTGQWLKKMGLADGLQLRRLGRSSRHELLVENHGETSNIKDVGVGVSQVLPVIVAALFAAPGHIVLIEEPESHLHPLAQSELAELFAQVSKERNVQFIVETHSEHLFRRMQTLMARQEVSADDSAMYFINREGNKASISKLNADPLGRVKNWPDKFFGDALGETREQTRAALEYRKKQG